MQIRLTKSFIAAGMMALALLTVASCKEKKKDYIIVTHKPIVVKSQKPRAMGDTQQSRHVSWLGNTYTVTVSLKADPSLPLASDGEQKYYDNRITLPYHPWGWLRVPGPHVYEGRLQGICRRVL